MRVLLAPHGTRGDIQPMLALAVALRARGTSLRSRPPRGFRGLDPRVRVRGDLERYRTSRPRCRSPDARLDSVRLDVRPPEGSHRARCSSRSRARAKAPTSSWGPVRSWRPRRSPSGVEVPHATICVLPCAMPHERRAAAHGQDADASSPWVNRLLWQVGSPVADVALRGTINRGRAALGLRSIDGLSTHISDSRVIIAADPASGAAGRRLRSASVVSTDAMIFDERHEPDPRRRGFLNLDPAPIYHRLRQHGGGQRAEELAGSCDRRRPRRSAVARSCSAGWAGLERLCSQTPTTLLTIGAIPHHARVSARGDDRPPRRRRDDDGCGVGGRAAGDRSASARSVLLGAPDRAARALVPARTAGVPDHRRHPGRPSRRRAQRRGHPQTRRACWDRRWRRETARNARSITSSGSLAESTRIDFRRPARRNDAPDYTARMRIRALALVRSRRGDGIRSARPHMPGRNAARSRGPDGTGRRAVGRRGEGSRRPPDASCIACRPRPAFTRRSSTCMAQAKAAGLSGRARGDVSRRRHDLVRHAARQPRLARRGRTGSTKCRPQPRRIISYDDVRLAVADNSESADVTVELVDVGAGTQRQRLRRQGRARQAGALRRDAVRVPSAGGRRARRRRPRQLQLEPGERAGGATIRI